MKMNLLLGNDYYLDVVLPQRIEVQDGLYFFSSKLRWIHTGRTGECEVNENDTSILILTYCTI